MFGKIRHYKVLAFTMDEITFGNLKARLGTITGQNVNSTVSRDAEAPVHFVSRLFIFDTTGTSIMKTRLKKKKE